MWSAFLEAGTEVATACSGEWKELQQETVWQRVFPKEAQCQEVVASAARSVVTELLTSSTALQCWLPRCMHEPEATEEIPLGLQLGDEGSERIQTNVSWKQVDGDSVRLIYIISVLRCQPEALHINLELSEERGDGSSESSRLNRCDKRGGQLHELLLFLTLCSALPCWLPDPV